MQCLQNALSSLHERIRKSEEVITVQTQLVLSVK